ASAQSTPPLDRFECYKATATKGLPRFVSVTGLPIVDGLGASHVNVLKPVHLCAPASLDNSDPSAPSHAEHLETYKLKRASGEPTFARVLHQLLVDDFGSLTVDILKPARFMVPSAKSLRGSPPAPADPATDHLT